MRKRSETIRTIAHISDLHFGKEIPEVAEGLLEDVREIHPDLVAISGDLTQRARQGQFLAAAEYLRRIPFPRIVVPGNHDVPLFHLLRKPRSPLRKYRTFLSNVIDPFYRDEEIAVYGMSTVRSFTISGKGRISAKEIREMEATLCPLPDRLFKIVVAHHPFIPPPARLRRSVVGRSEHALKEMEKCGIELVLAGHLHRGYHGETLAHYPTAEKSTLIVQAGTTISSRTRREPNSYNLLSIVRGKVVVTIRAWDGEAFRNWDVTAYRKEAHEWKRVV